MQRQVNTLSSFAIDYVFGNSFRCGLRIEEQNTEKWNEMASYQMIQQLAVILQVLKTIPFYNFKLIIHHLPPSETYILSIHSTSQGYHTTIQCCQSTADPQQILTIMFNQYHVLLVSRAMGIYVMTVLRQDNHIARVLQERIIHKFLSEITQQCRWFC